MADSVSARMQALTTVVLVDQVVDSIVQAAAEGRFLPGDRLKEAEIGRELNVSRVPVREALLVLESHKLAVSAPYKGMRLVEFDDRQLRNIASVRASLELLALSEVLDRSSKDGTVLDGVRLAVQKMGQAAQAGESFAVARHDMEFHRQLCLASGNEVLSQLWESLSLRLMVVLGLCIRDMDLMALHRSHVELLDLFASGDRVKAKAALRAHIVEDLMNVDYQVIVDRLRARRTSR
ncbi:GntR family transcriptional regulator [Mesorhizobium qingshengii]|uniref:GntR family transcriptional regulator n=1 Tax=Mesorhizobium qingshengii TaxID=1165689 RepID=A0ABT4QY49_9HYPH|nr:GntR family transcriptional regulator [Mesorhizobium qingshengii]MCZ8546506.1 GntR family transcriptional regulator [Mesorhizobium qingshengii]